ncbi:MAG: ABC transporter ATP-binding protein [Schleiferilactobacillus harbinensis]|uniref:ABC transporter ATP-binding protein n=1 Tax=Schleiferilactobacillus harbinensis TaxID=304207 RepID=A0ABU7SY74_9LACO|nr:ABC transporter ATP-binding protein [Schleiferilactobacillus harbinensis]MCI1850395.1 ABC transporter ATP-binding protein [Schleiferilactobacillus harbinensis]HAY54081.1 macrolide ABC transporter ATP-binding protein [Lactobacillus sp.]
MITMQHVVKSYTMGDEHLVVLKDVNLTVEAGEFLAIMGPSGSGKSTMMNIMGLLDTFDSGLYQLRDTDVTHLSDNERAHVRNKEIGFVFQSFNLMPRMTLLENVALPMVYAGIGRRERQDRAAAALTQVGLGDRLDHQPNEISGGQMQRVAIARAIVNRPAVIMADEPTGNLDSKTSVEIIRIFQELNAAGTTVVMVTHEPDIAQYTKRIISFRDGIIQTDQVLDQPHKAGVAE